MTVLKLPEIPKISDHKINNRHLMRQMDLIPLEVLSTPITVIGAGAIGGWVALALVKMGASDVTVYDDDKVSAENLSSQYYSYQDIGVNKAKALQSEIEEMTGERIKIVPKRYSGGQFPGIVIAAVDNMSTRALIWEHHTDRAPFTKAIIDPRMGAWSTSLYVMDPMDPEDQEDYPKTLCKDEDAVQERCTAKATIFTANLLAGMVCKAAVDVLTRPDPIRIMYWNIKENQMKVVQKKDPNAVKPPASLL